MNELLVQTPVPGTAPGGGASAPVARPVPEKPAGVPAAGVGVPPALPSVQIGKPGYRFKFPVESPQGQEERREHERLRKADKRAAVRVAEPPPLPTPPVVDSPQAPAGQLDAGAMPPGDTVVVEVVPWLAKDIADFTDELVELAEVKRVKDFVALARDAGMPAKFIAEVEKRSHYPTNSKAALKRCLSECAAKWLNKTGVSSASKEEVKLLFVMVTVKLQGIRLKRDLAAMIEDDRARREAAQAKEVKP